jgi:hypothetical protein
MSGNGGNGYGPPSMFGMPPPGAPASASAAAASGAAGYSQAVSRSDELLSCAKTAVKLAKRRNQQQQQQHEHNHEVSQWWSVDVEALHLHGTNSTLYDDGSMSSNPYLEEAIELLRGMHGELQALEGLVKRRGHTNDPTDEIQACTDRLQRDTQELLEALNRVIPPKARGQSQRHYQLVSDWIKGAAQEQGHRLQQVLKTRAAVLAEQAQRRKMFTTTTSATTTSSATASMASALPLSSAAAIPSSSTSSAVLSRSNPLFTIPVPPTKTKPNLGAAPSAASHFHRNQAPHQQANGGNSSSSSSGYHAHGRTTTAAAAAASSGYGSRAAPIRAGPGNASASAAGSRPGPAYSTGSYYGYGYGGTPYGGSSGGGIGSNGSTTAAASGMRQRRPGAAAAAAASANAASHDSYNQQQQEQERLLVRQQERQAQERLREARQAESSLVELGTLFGKMTHLISSQGEIVAKIEDDVEAAVLDINAGHAEIQTLYGIKKGNRGLILKTFGLLIFFIVFMRLYKSK